jgi:hypothetical protein
MDAAAALELVKVAPHRCARAPAARSKALLTPRSRVRSRPRAASVLYAPYQNIYSKTDMFYSSSSAFKSAGLGVNAFGPTQSYLNVAEIVLNVRARVFCLR